MSGVYGELDFAPCFVRTLEQDILIGNRAFAPEDVARVVPVSHRSDAQDFVAGATASRAMAPQALPGAIGR